MPSTSYDQAIDALLITEDWVRDLHDTLCDLRGYLERHRERGRISAQPAIKWEAAGCVSNLERRIRIVECDYMVARSEQRGRLRDLQRSAMKAAAEGN